jgi:hypothetical protein
MKSVQTAFRLPAEMHERLRRAGDDVSKEIRRRLEESFAAEDTYDAATRSLGEDVMELALLIEQQAKTTWHGHVDVHAAVRAAIDSYLERTAPIAGEGQAAPPIRGFSPRERAESTGRMVAGNFVHNRALRERKRAELAQLRNEYDKLTARIAELEKPEKEKGPK